MQRSAADLGTSHLSGRLSLGGEGAFYSLGPTDSRPFGTRPRGPSPRWFNLRVCLLA